MGSVDGTGLVIVELRALPRAPVDLPAGEARGEIMLRMTDLRFTGWGSAEESMEVLAGAHCTLKTPLYCPPS